jgi:peptidoglycan/LPS O-acetylase OafA/YrhL
MRYRGPAITGSDRIPELDGLRGVAILTVILAHYSGKAYAPGGFGVTLFFVISGFIITRLFLAEINATGSIAIGRFYARRFIRLMPALTVAVASIAVATVLLGEAFSIIPVVAALTYLKNYQTLFLPDHIGPPLANLGIYWSLAVEEHFYLVFPLLLLGFRRQPAAFCALLAGLIAACLAWRLALILHFEVPAPRTYMGSDTRFDSPLMGALLACLCRLREQNGQPVTSLANWSLPAGLLLILISFLIRDPIFRETFRYSIQNIGIALCLFGILYGPALSWPRRLLASGPLHGLGVISYSLYLWHIFILYLAIRFSPAEMPRLAVAAGAAVAALAVAYLSWRFLEKGMERFKARFAVTSPKTPVRRPDQGSAGFAEPAAQPLPAVFLWSK